MTGCAQELEAKWLALLARDITFRSEGDPPCLVVEAGAAVTASEDLVRGASDSEKLREKSGDVHWWPN